MQPEGEASACSPARIIRWANSLRKWNQNVCLWNGGLPLLEGGSSCIRNFAQIYRNTEETNFSSHHLPEVQPLFQERILYAREIYYWGKLMFQMSGIRSEPDMVYLSRIWQFCRQHTLDKMFGMVGKYLETLLKLLLVEKPALGNWTLAMLLNWRCPCHRTVGSHQSWRMAGSPQPAKRKWSHFIPETLLTELHIMNGLKTSMECHLQLEEKQFRFGSGLQLMTHVTKLPHKIMPVSLIQELQRILVRRYQLSCYWHKTGL